MSQSDLDSIIKVLIPVGFSIMPVIVLVRIIYLIIICYKKTGPPALNDTMNGTRPSVVPAYTPVAPSQVQMVTIDNFLREIERERPIRFSREELESRTQNYSTKLGSGGFGNVFKGRLRDGTFIAVKVLHAHLGKLSEGQFMAEVRTLSRTYHINLVRLFGFCVEAGFSALVYEYMGNGALDTALFAQYSNGGMSFLVLHKIAVGTARGIRYLHEECEKKIIHYDIKPGNILLDENYNPKVADFGLAELLNREKTHVSLLGGKGTPGYLAPEMVMAIGVTEKCDVYSFGKLLFEIVGRRKSFVDASNTAESQQYFPQMVWERYKNGRLRETVVSIHGTMDETDREKAERMCMIALWCVQKQAEVRPTMSEVVRMLEGEMDIPPPLNPFEHLEVLIPTLGFSSGSSINSSSN